MATNATFYTAFTVCALGLVLLYCAMVVDVADLIWQVCLDRTPPLQVQVIGGALATLVYFVLNGLLRAVTMVFVPAVNFLRPTADVVAFLLLLLACISAADLAWRAGLGQRLAR